MALGVGGGYRYQELRSCETQVYPSPVTVAYTWKSTRTPLGLDFGFVYDESGANFAPHQDKSLQIIGPCSNCPTMSQEVRTHPFWGRVYLFIYF